MECPGCGSSYIRNNGKKRGKQNHICCDCDRQFIDRYELPQGYGDEVKRECLKMYVNGIKFRGITQGILAWVLGDHSAETFRPLWDIVGT